MHLKKSDCKKSISQVGMVRGPKVIRKLRHLFQLFFLNTPTRFAQGQVSQSNASVAVDTLCIKKKKRGGLPNTGLDTFHNSDKFKITDSRVYSHIHKDSDKNKDSYGDCSRVIIWFYGL